MPSSTLPYVPAPGAPTHAVKEQQIEYGFIGKLQGLKYEYRADIRDRAALERNFREKFDALNRVTLTDGEFKRLLDDIVTRCVHSVPNPAQHQRLQHCRHPLPRQPRLQRHSALTCP